MCVRVRACVHISVCVYCGVPIPVVNAGTMSREHDLCWDSLSLSFLCHHLYAPYLVTNGKKVSIKGVLIREVSLFQGLNCMQELFLGKEKCPLLERCPHFRGVLREGA